MISKDEEQQIYQKAKSAEQELIQLEIEKLGGGEWKDVREYHQDWAEYHRRVIEMCNKLIKEGKATKDTYRTIADRKGRLSCYD